MRKSSRCSVKSRCSNKTANKHLKRCSSPFQMCTQLNATRSRSRPPPSRIIWSSTSTKKRRWIRFGTNTASNQWRALILSSSVFGLMLAWVGLAFVIQSCTDELDHMQKNITGVFPRHESIQCIVLDRQCNCRMSSNGTHVHDSCVTRLHLHVMKILPLLSLVLQPFALQESFTLAPNCARFFVPMASSVSPLVYATVVIVMYTIHCYHTHLIVSIYATSGILFFLGVHELCENRMVGCKQDRTVLPSTPQVSSSPTPLPPATQG